MIRLLKMKGPSMKKAAAAPILAWGVIVGLLALAPSPGIRPAPAQVPTEGER